MNAHPDGRLPARARSRFAPLFAVAACALLVPARHGDGAPERVGVLLWTDGLADRASLAGIREGIGLWSHDRTVVDVRIGGGTLEAAQNAARELRDGGAALLFAIGPQAARAALDAIADRPIVFTAVTDPVGAGLARSLMGSRRNCAGNSDRVDPVEMLRLSKLAVPRLETLGVLQLHRAGVEDGAAWEVQQARLARQRPGAIELDFVVRAQAVGADEPFDAVRIETAVDELLAAGADAVWLPGSAPDDLAARVVAGRARRARIPVLASSVGCVRAGLAVAGLAVDRELLGTRAVELAREIVTTGVDPGILPVGELHAIHRVVHLGAARASGVEVPLALLVGADEILQDDLAQSAPGDGGGEGR